MPVNILIVLAGWRGLSGAFAKSVSPLRASMIMALFADISLLKEFAGTGALSTVFFFGLLLAVAVIFLVEEGVLLTTFRFTLLISLYFPRVMIFAGELFFLLFCCFWDVDVWASA